MAPLTVNNYEDWDFRHCTADNRAGWDADCTFFQTHTTTAVRVQAVRAQVIATFVDRGLVSFQENGAYAVIGGSSDALLRGYRGGAGRFPGFARVTREGRFERNVVEAMRREHAKYGRLRVTILPPR